MGRSWFGVIMPLLSTLAALVILAHSAEEEQRRHDISPRLSEPGSPDYEQSWRAVDTQPLTEPEEEWGVEIAPQEPPKRRRPGRKRRRRPQPPTAAGLLPDEEQRRLYFGAEEAEGEMKPPRRRRKRPDGRAPEELPLPEHPRPLRRRGYRRKQRPLASDAEPEVPERPDDTTPPPEPDRRPLHPEDEEPDGDRITMDDLIEEPKDASGERDASAADPPVPAHRDVQEMPGEDSPTEEKRDKSYRIPYSLARKQEQSKDGTSKIKELLKQSGGLSLSELLQQRNLSLSDLLNGKQNAISALKFDSSVIPEELSYREDGSSNLKTDHIQTEEIHSSREPNTHENIDTAVQDNDEIITTEPDLSIKPLLRRFPQVKPYKNNEDSKQESDTNVKDHRPSDLPRRRLPPLGTRRKVRQRIRNPHTESSTVRIRSKFNFQSAHPKRENTTTTESSISQEIENIIDLEITNATIEKHKEDQTTTTNVDMITNTEEATTTIVTTTMKEPQTEKYYEKDEATATENVKENETVKPKLLVPALRPKLLATNSELRRQALNSRQRKKKLRNKAVIPNNAEEIPVQDLFGMTNLVSASEFITKIQTTQPPTSTTTENDLPDLFTEESTNIDADSIVTDRIQENIVEQTEKKREMKQPRYTTVRQKIFTSTARNSLPTLTTEESAKDEILEVFKDMHGGARLAKILSERNMTINELVEHRERGSSQIHLADIFHNASREPNPPEPFLSKSLIEPISKETYPLRALLEANSHDPPGKLATQNTYAAQFTNIPLIVDYGKNINENGENLGIVALFNEFANSKAKYEKHIKKDSEGTAYFTSVMSLNTTDYSLREGRTMPNSNKRLEDFLNNAPNAQISGEKTEEAKPLETNASSTTPGTTITTGKSYPEHDLDGDGLIVLEDLQHLNELDNLAQAINEKLEVNVFEHAQNSNDRRGFLGKIPSSVRSATIASAAIVGLAIVLFLLTYMGCKWRQRRKELLRKNSVRGERIPTPVFENRKLNWNCSNRSISPMLASTTGFTMNTLDSQAGQEAPDYMWDTLHKPFQ